MQARAAGDLGLARQADINAQSSMRSALNLADEAEERRKVRASLDSEIQNRTEYDSQQDAEISRNAGSIEAEARQRVEGDYELAQQAEANAEANIYNAFNIYEVNARRKADISREVQTRAAGDLGLARQADINAQSSMRNALNLAEEAEERRKVRASLDTEIRERTEYDTQQDAEISRNAGDIEAETQQRVEGDYELAQQADANTEANIHNTFNIYEVNARRKADISREVQARAAGDLGLARQADINAQSSIRNALNLADEAEKRRKSDQRIESLEGKAGRQNIIDDCQQCQIDAAILSILQNILTLSEALSRSRNSLYREKQSRYEEDSRIQSQVSKNAQTSMRNALHIHAEAEKRRRLSAQIIEEMQRRREIGDTVDIISYHFQRQIDSLTHASLEDALNLSEALSRQREILNQEAITRTAQDAQILQQVLQERQTLQLQDDGIQAQMNQLAIASMWLSVREHETRSRMKEVEAKTDEVITIPGRAATDDEFDEMLDSLYSNT